MSIKKNLQIYEQKAQNYAEAYRSLKSPDVLPYFTDRLAKVSKPESFMVLDLACGSGRDAAYMAEMGFTVIAVDGSKEMLPRRIDVTVIRLLNICRILVLNLMH